MFTNRETIIKSLEERKDIKDIKTKQYVDNTLRTFFDKKKRHVIYWSRSNTTPWLCNIREVPFRKNKPIYCYRESEIIKYIENVR